MVPIAAADVGGGGSDGSGGQLRQQAAAVVVGIGGGTVLVMFPIKHDKGKTAGKHPLDARTVETSQPG